MSAYALAGICGFIALLSEIVLARALNFTLNSFAAWMCVSFALFGIGLGGLLFEWRPKPGRWPWAALGILLVVFPALHNWASNHLWFLIFMVSLPSALTGWLLLQTFSANENLPTRIYAIEMAGGALGALAAYFLIGPLSPGQILAAAGLLCLVVSQKRLGVAAGVAVAVFLVMFWFEPSFLDFHSEGGKRFSPLLENGASEYSRWTSAAKVDVVESHEGIKQIVYDGGEMVSTIYPFDGDYAALKKNIFERIFTDFWTPGVAAPHFLKEGQATRVLLVGAAGGQEIKAARLFGAREIEVAEIMGELLELGKTKYAKFNGEIFLQPGVRLFERDARAYLRAQPADALYDVIQLNSVHGSSSRGSSMGALQVSSLVTVEAFEEYFRRLSADGILHISHPYYPRLIATMSQAWLKTGRSAFRAHVVVVESAGPHDFLTSVFVKMNPWAASEVERLERFYHMTDGRYRTVENPLGRGRLSPEYFGGQWAELEARLPYRIFPATDDRPYFKFLRRSFFNTPPARNPEITPDLENYLYRWKEGSFAGDVLPLARMIEGGLAILIVALFLRLRGKGGEWRPTLYFLFTGFGFMALETYFIYQLTLWWGSPHAAWSFGLAVFMSIAGLGGFLNPFKSSVAACSAAVVGAISGFWAAKNGWPVPALLVAGAALGLPFVSGLRSLNLQGRERSMAFLASGLGAGFGGGAAVIISLVWSFSSAFEMGCAAYLLAIATRYRHTARAFPKA